MNGEDDDESDKGRDDEEDSDDTQAEVDKRVAQMLKNQQQYLRMCNSSAHILQLLSHLVPAISGQVMGLESVTEDSEEATSRSDSASSSHSPATSDDNTGCVLWAEPIMTCQLMPSWKPFCGDVRRLPPGVKPEDIKSQHIPTCRGSNIRGYHSAAAAAAAAANARNRCLCTANKNNGLGSASTSRGTNAHDSPKEGDTRASTTQLCRNERDAKTGSLEDKMPKNSQLPNPQMMRTSAGCAPKAPNAADAIKRTKQILAAVTAGRQSNNNNNPEEVSDTKGNTDHCATPVPDNGRSSNVTADPGNDRHAVDLASSATSGDNPKEISLMEQNETPSSTHFPAPILVKAAGVQGDTVDCRSEKIGDGTDENNVTQTVSNSANPNSSDFTGNVYEICHQTSQTDEFTTQSPPAGKSEEAGRKDSNERILWGRLPGRIDARSSRIMHRARPNGQLYRHPASSCALHPRSRTQQSVSLGCVETEKQILPTSVYLPTGSQSSKQPGNEQLELDFKHINIYRNTHRPTRKHIITLTHLKNALKIAMHNLQKMNVWTVEANSLGKEPSPHTRSTISTFTVTDVESLNITADHAEKDSMSSEMVGPIFSDLTCERTDIVDVNGSGDASKATADSFTEVESIVYIQNRSPAELKNNLEVCTESHVLSCSDGEEREGDRNRTNSSCQRQKEELVCSRCSSDARVGGKDQGGTQSPMSSKNPIHASSALKNPIHASPTASSQVVSNCNTETSCINTETTVADHSSIKETVMREKYLKGEARTQEKCHQSSPTVKDTTVPHLIHNSDETPVGQSGSNTGQWKDEVVLLNSHFLNASLKFPRAKSAEHSQCGAHLSKGAKRSRPYSTGEKKTLEGDNDLSNVVVVKNRDDFPPHFPEAGDTVENLNIIENIKNNSYGASQSGIIPNDIEKQNTPKRTEDSRKDIPKPSRKRNLQKVAKRLLFIQTGRSNNASQERESTFKTKNDVLLAPTLVQSANQETHYIDEVSESKIEQENQKRGPYLQDSGLNVVLKPSVKQQNVEDDVIRNHRHTCDRKQEHNSSSISDLNYHLVSLPQETPEHSQPEEDVFLNIKDKPATKTSDETPRSASDSFVTSHRTNKGRPSKVERNREGMRKQDGKLTKEITPSNVIISRSNCNQYLDMIPGFMPPENFHTLHKLPGKSTKNVLILTELTDIPLTTMKCDSKATFCRNLDKQLEQTEIQTNVQISSAVAENGSPDSSKSSSMEAPSVTQNDVPELATSAVVNTPSATPLLHEELPSVTSGIKARVRRFFSQCLRPFSHRN